MGAGGGVETKVIVHLMLICLTMLYNVTTGNTTNILKWCDPNHLKIIIQSLNQCQDHDAVTSSTHTFVKAIFISNAWWEC